MITIFVTALITCLASLALIFFFGYWGVLFATLISTSIGSYLWLALSGFGSPTARVPKHTFYDYIITAIPIFIGSFLISYGCYYLKSLIIKESAPKIVTIIWASSLLLLTSFYAGRKIINHINERDIYIELGFNKEFDLRWDNVTVSLVKGSKSERCSFNSRGGSRKKNRFGYSSHLSSFKKLYFKPKEILVKILDKKELPISLPENTKDINIFVDKNYKLKLFVNEELFSTHQLE